MMKKMLAFILILISVFKLSVSAFETDSIVKGIDDLETADYSEAHLVWFAKNSATTDTTHPTYGIGRISKISII